MSNSFNDPVMAEYTVRLKRHENIWYVELLPNNDPSLLKTSAEHKVDPLGSGLYLDLFEHTLDAIVSDAKQGRG